MSEVKPITLDDLQPTIVVAKLKTRYGRVLEVPFMTLSWQEWDDLGRSVPDPKVPYTKLSDSGERVPNYDDLRYKEQLEQAATERIARRLFASLERAGNEFPGETALEKYENLKKSDRALVEGLTYAIIRSGLGEEAEIEAIADSFPEQSTSESDPAHLPETRLDNGRILVALKE
jgi:hypothetical protein